MDPRKFAVIGGDLRNVKLAEAIHSDGNNVNLFGFKNAGLFQSAGTDGPEEVDRYSEIVIGPLPCTNDNEVLNAPFHDRKVHISEVFKSMKKISCSLQGG